MLHIGVFLQGVAVILHAAGQPPFAGQPQGLALLYTNGSCALRSHRI